MKFCSLKIPYSSILNAKIGNLATHSYSYSYSYSKSHDFVIIPSSKSLDFPPNRTRGCIISNSKAIESVDVNDDSSEIQLIPILSQEQFNQIVVHNSPDSTVVILWMASWCRKCIYLKPKLEKLAADYFPRICFYSVDVNAVPRTLVTMANVSKMPTIQVWKDKKKQGEVIGGNKAYLVVNEVCEMIDNLNGGSQ